MGFLDKLWDETVAGPAPEFGLSKLRKSKTFNDRPAGVTPLSVSFGDPPASAPATAPAAAATDDQIPVSRSISILRRSNSVSPGSHAVDSPGSGPASPATSTPTTTPTSPFSPTTPGGINNKKLARRNTTPTGYDWIVLSALDR